MISFCDTSSLFKKYVDEAGSRDLHVFFEEARVVHASALTQLEICSSLEISRKTSRINSPMYREACRMMEKDFALSLIKALPILPEILSSSMNLIRQRKLRAPDAIQLASALFLQKKTGEKVIFACSDKHLIEAAKLEGIKVFNPEDE